MILVRTAKSNLIPSNLDWSNPWELTSKIAILQPLSFAVARRDCKSKLSSEVIFLSFLISSFQIFMSAVLIATAGAMLSLMI